MNQWELIIYLITASIIITSLSYFYKQASNALRINELKHELINILLIEEGIVNESVNYELSIDGRLIINQESIIIESGGLTISEKNNNISLIDCEFNNSLIISDGVISCV